ncbi:hypothetical protein MKHDV_00094 [Halodesulfovibrio sp. MK-HDV]|nr:hypothetical protein MKHDV_00094 [Halodesulfovibrio sp. MK-HDV]
MENVTVERIRLELGKLNLRLHPTSRYRVAEMTALVEMMLEDLAPYRISDVEFCAVISRWRVKNNFVPTSRDVLEQLAIVREDMNSHKQLALNGAPESREEVFSEEYCEAALQNIASILGKVNAASPAKNTPRQYGSRV